MLCQAFGTILYRCVCVVRSGYYGTISIVVAWQQFVLCHYYCSLVIRVVHERHFAAIPFFVGSLVDSSRGPSLLLYRSKRGHGRTRSRKRLGPRLPFTRLPTKKGMAAKVAQFRTESDWNGQGEGDGAERREIKQHTLLKVGYDVMCLSLCFVLMVHLPRVAHASFDSETPYTYHPVMTPLMTRMRYPWCRSLS